MNLLYLTPGRVGGTEVYAAELLRALTRSLAPEAITLFLRPSARRWGPPEAAQCARVVVPTTDLHPMVRIGVEATLLPRIARRAQVDVLHSLGYHGPWWGNVPSVVTVHDTNYADFLHGSWRGRALGVAVPRAMAQADAVITASAFFQDRLRARHLATGGAIVTIPYGPGTSTQGAEWAPSATDRYFLVFGAVSANKNLPRVAHAWQHVVSHLPGWQLRVVGSVSEKVSSLLRAVPGVVLEGYVTEERKRELLCGAQALIMPSLYEGFGFPAVEAMALGVPLAASGTTALGEVVGDGGLAFDPTQIGDIAEVMIQIASSPSLRQELSRRALHRASHFSWDACAHAHLAVYADVLRRAQARRGLRAGAGRE